MKNEWNQLREENRLRQERLREQDQDVLQDVLDYLKSMGRNPYDLEVLRKDLIGMAEEAQSRGENLQAVIGADRKEFYEGLAETMRSCSLKDWPFFMTPSAGVGFLIVLSFCLIPKRASFSIEMDLGFLIFTLFWELYGGALSLFYQLHRFQAQPDRPNYKMFLLMGATLPFAIGISMWLSALSRDFIYKVPIAVVVLLPLGLYLLLRRWRQLRITQLAQQNPWQDGANLPCEH